MTEKRIVGFVGKPYKHFISWLSQQGFEVQSFIAEDANYTFPDEITRIHRLDFSSIGALGTTLPRDIATPLCFVNTYENAVLPKAWLCELYSLPGPSESAALLSTDKYLMRQAFQKSCPQYSPSFAQVSNWAEVEAFLSRESIGFPLILKPTNLFKSLLVTKNENLEELKKNFDSAIKNIREIYRKESVNFPPNLIIEEYLDGPSFSLEVFVNEDGETTAAPSPVDLIMGRDRGENDNYNYSRKLPSSLTLEQQSRLKEAALAGVKALGLYCSPAHVELVNTVNGPKLIEIGARTGGYRPRMHQLADGINLFDAQLMVAQGKLPSLTKKENKNCAVYEIFPTTEGHFAELENVAGLLQLESLYYSSIKASMGQRVGPAKNGYRAVVVIILASESDQIFRRDAEFIEQKVKVALQNE